MRILLVNHFPLEGSGSGTYTMNTAQHLAKRGHEVRVVFPENRPPAPLPGVGLCPVPFTASDGAQEALPGALPFNFPCFTTHPRSLTTFDDLSQAELDQYLDAFRAALDDAVGRFRPDIIHAQHVWALGALAAQTGVPTILTAHGTDMMGCRRWPRLCRFAEEAVAGCRRIIAISKDNYEDTVSTLLEAAPKMTLLLNGYNEDVFYPEATDRAALLAAHGVPDAGGPIVLFAGKLTGFKGVDTLLRAAVRYERQDPRVVTLLAGSGEEREVLEQLRDELGLQRVCFLGHQSQDSLRQLYSAADVFAMPSRREPFGLVALEAMACGLPVVATDQGGLAEFVTEEAGALVAVDDDAALAEALMAELARSQAQPGRRQAIADAVRAGYAQSGFVARLEGLYDQVLSA